jgi:hypothetical protein
MTPTERIQQTREEVEKVILTDQEKEEAILEGKKKKYFKEKHGQYWDEKESKNIVV